MNAEPDAVHTFDLARYDAAVFDLDGTVWLSGEPIPGAVEYLDRCRDAGLIVAFATNITLTSVDDVRSALVECGLAKPRDAVVTAGSALTLTVAKAGVTEVVGLCSSSLTAALEARGIKVVSATDVDRRAWRDVHPGRAIVMTGCPGATLRDVETVGQLAAWGHPVYVSSLEPGFPGRDGFEPGAGMMVAAARSLHRFEPIVCGKPSAGFAAVVMAELPDDASIVMFGDSQRADVALADMMAADSVLVVGEPGQPVAADLATPTYVTPALATAPQVYPKMPPEHREMRVERGIVYAQIDGYRPLELDLYLPGDDHEHPLPILVFVHGGGWRVSSRTAGPRETREWTRGVFARLTDAGFAVAAVEYRYSGEALHPAPIDDVTAAIGWLRANAPTCGLDGDRVVLWGQSAGGHVAASVGLSMDAAPVRAVICWYPITDFPALDGHDDQSFAAMYLGHKIGDDLDHARDASATSRVRGDAPAFLLQHGTADTMAPFEQSERLRAALQAEGADVRLDAVDGAEHFFAGHDDVEAIFDDMVSFARKHI